MGTLERRTVISGELDSSSVVSTLGRRAMNLGSIPPEIREEDEQLDGQEDVSNPHTNILTEESNVDIEHCIRPSERTQDSQTIILSNEGDAEVYVNDHPLEETDIEHIPSATMITDDGRKLSVSDNSCKSPCTTQNNTLPDCEYGTESEITSEVIHNPFFQI